jgi:hypothetical protein
MYRNCCSPLKTRQTALLHLSCFMLFDNLLLQNPIELIILCFVPFCWFVPCLNGGFLSHRATPSSHPFIDRDFPWNKPIILGILNGNSQMLDSPGAARFCSEFLSRSSDLARWSRRRKRQEEKRRKSLVNDHILTYLWEKIWLFTRIYGLFISYPHFMRIEPCRIWGFSKGLITL